MTKEQMEKVEDKVLFEPGVLEVTTPEGLELTVQEVEVNPEIAKIFGIMTTQPLTAQSKTATFSPRIVVTGTAGELAAIEDAKVTVTKMTNPSTGVAFLTVYFEYFATSLGWRSGRLHGEANGVPQTMEFKNSAGGVMYGWTMPPFDVICGWNRKHQVRGKTENNFISWFDLWGKATYRNGGTFYRC